MAIPNNAKREIPPTHPGEMLREDFMPDYGLTTATLAEALGVTRQTINELLRNRRSVTPVMALRLSRLFGNSPEFWLGLQMEFDLREEKEEIQKDLDTIHNITELGLVS